MPALTRRNAQLRFTQRNTQMRYNQDMRMVRDALMNDNLPKYTCIQKTLCNNATIGLMSLPASAAVAFADEHSALQSPPCLIDQ